MELDVWLELRLELDVWLELDVEDNCHGRDLTFRSSDDRRHGRVANPKRTWTCQVFRFFRPPEIGRFGIIFSPEKTPGRARTNLFVSEKLCGVEYGAAAEASL